MSCFCYFWNLNPIYCCVEACSMELWKYLFDVSSSLLVLLCNFFSSLGKYGVAFCLDLIIPVRYMQDEVVWKTQSFDKLRVEAEKCLAQSERFSNEKTEFEDAIYAKVCGLH